MDVLKAFINSPYETFELDPLPYSDDEPPLVHDEPPIQESTSKTGSLKLNLTRISDEQCEDRERVSDDAPLLTGNTPTSTGRENNEVVLHDDKQKVRDLTGNELGNRAYKGGEEIDPNRLSASTKKKESSTDCVGSLCKRVKEWFAGSNQN